MRHFSQILLLCAMFFGASVAAQVGGTVKPLDLSFLKENPYRKQKIGVDLSTIQTAEDLEVVKEAVNPIVWFFSTLSLGHDLNSLSAKLTEGASQRLRFPPLMNLHNPSPNSVAEKRSRVIHKNQYDWTVVDKNTIAVTCSFGFFDLKGDYIDRFVFVKDKGVWKFDRHDWEQPQQRPDKTKSK